MKEYFINLKRYLQKGNAIILDYIVDREGRNLYDVILNINGKKLHNPSYDGMFDALLLAEDFLLHPDKQSTAEELTYQSSKAVNENRLLKKLDYIGDAYSELYNSPAFLNQFKISKSFNKLNFSKLLWGKEIEMLAETLEDNSICDVLILGVNKLELDINQSLLTYANKEIKKTK